MRTGRKLLLWLFFSLLFISAAFAGAVLYVSSNLKQIVTTALNEQLNAKVQVNTVDVTVFANFPKVSLRFQQLSVQTNLKGVEPLGEAGELLLAFSVWDMLAGRYYMQEIGLNNASLLLEDAPEGATWDIFKPSPGGGAGGKFKLDLRRIKLNNVNVVYKDAASGQEHSLLLSQLTLSGAFSDKDFTMEADGRLRVNQLRFDRLRMLRDKDVEISTALDVKNGGEAFNLGTTRLDIEGLKLSAEGSLKEEKGYVANLRVKGENLDLKSFVGILPEQVGKALADYKSEGNFYFDGSLSGALQQPHMELKAGLKGVSLQHPGLPKAIRDLQASISFNNGTTNRLSEARLEVRDLSAALGSGKFSGSLLLQDLLDPEIEAHFDSRLNLAELSQMVYLPGVSKLSGDASVHFDYSGQLTDLRDPRKVMESGASGSAEFQNIVCQLDTPQLGISASYLKADVYRGALRIEDFTGEVNEMPLEASLNAENFLPYLFSEGKRLRLMTNLDFETLDLNRLLPAPGKAQTATDAEKKDLRGTWPRDIVLHARVKSKAFKLDKLKAEQVRAVATLDQTGLEIEEVSGKTMEGSCQLSGKLYAHQTGAMDLKLSGSMKDINISQLFASFDNFGQQEITAAHLSGKLRADIEAFVPFDNKGNLVEDKLTTVADLELKNGQLTGYKPLESLSRFADIKDLQNLQFASLKNRITLKNRNITIPDMEVKNNALNLFVSGEHNFDNVVDYRFRIKLGDVLSKKHRERHPKEDFGEEEADERRGITLYISMKGPLSNLKITYDRAGVKASLKEDARKEKQSLKELFKEELGEPTLEQQGFIEEEEEPVKPLFPRKKDKEKPAAEEAPKGNDKSRPKSVDLDEDIPR